MKMLRLLPTLALGVVATLGLTSPASAGLLTLEIVRTAGPTLTVVDNSVDDSDPLEDSIKISESAVPEPATLLLFGAGLAAVIIARRRKK